MNQYPPIFHLLKEVERMKATISSPLNRYHSLL
nr:MAG TPA: hypothetical protein [Caudoviricetes sp.]